MRAVYAESFNPDDPLAGLVVGDRPEHVPVVGATGVSREVERLSEHHSDAPDPGDAAALRLHRVRTDESGRHHRHSGRDRRP